jgi:hypothetical protein
MGLTCTNDDDDDCVDNKFVPHAATGKLIAVYPGEVVETTFKLLDDHQWQLRIGVVEGGGEGDDSFRFSTVVADRPFMGLVPTTSSWMEEIYDQVYIGSCLENYGMKGPENYPSSWEINIDIQVPAPPKKDDTATTTTTTASWSWSEWRLEKYSPSCPWQPESFVQSLNGTQWQKAVWNATLKKANDVVVAVVAG